MATKKVRILEFVKPSKVLKAQEEAINRALQEHFPQIGPVSLMETEDGEIAVKMTLLVGPGHKGKLDEAYRFVMKLLGEARGRKPGERRVPVKYYLPSELHRRVQEAARHARRSASDLVTDYLREKFG